MKINWITYNNRWAYYHLAQHIAKKLSSKFTSLFNYDKSANIEIAFNPDHFKTKQANSRTILHLDSNRWYDHLIK